MSIFSDYNCGAMDDFEFKQACARMNAEDRYDRGVPNECESCIHCDRATRECHLGGCESGAEEEMDEDTAYDILEKLTCVFGGCSDGAEPIPDNYSLAAIETALRCMDRLYKLEHKDKGEV